MIKFYLIMALYIVFSISIFCGFGSNNGSYIGREGKAAHWSKDAQQNFNTIVKWGFRIFAIFIILILVLPMAKDIPNIISNKQMSITGKVEHENALFGTRFIRQSITVENVTVYQYFGRPLFNGDYRTINYLPNSKFVIDVIE